jgi:adenylate cyclase
VKTPPLVLVVDDDKSNVDILRTRLAAQGYAIVTAGDGEAGLAAARAHRPDLILLDVNMPRLDGLEACRRLKGDPTLPFVPVILVTARGDARDVVAGLDAGADEYLTKPVIVTELVARVKSMLRIKELHDRVQMQSAELAEWTGMLERRVEEQVRQLDQLGRLKRFFSPALAELIVHGGVDDPLRTRRREIVMVILDLVGFTTFASTAEPEDIITVLRHYHTEMGQLVLAHDGTLERFAGDSINVIFNDPIEMPDAPERAVRMAWAMRERARQLAAEWERNGWRLPLRIGVAMGHATIGTIGFEGRLDYGVVGRVVGLAAALSNAAEAGDLLVSQNVASAVEAAAELEEVPALTSQWFTRPVRAFRVQGLKA